MVGRGLNISALLGEGTHGTRMGRSQQVSKPVLTLHWEAVGPTIHVAVTPTQALLQNTEQSFMEMAPFDGCALWGGNAAKKVQERFEEHSNVYQVLMWP